MTIQNTELEHVLIRLRTLLDEVWDQRPAGAAASADAPLASIGLDSLTLALLFDRVGTEFRLDWTVDTPPGAAGSLRSIAELVLRRRGASAAEAPGA